MSLQLARPKTMQGQWVTGRMLAGLAEAYVSAINAHAVPSIGNAWDGVTKVECAVSCRGGGTKEQCPLHALLLPPCTPSRWTSNSPLLYAFSHNPNLTLMRLPLPLQDAMDAAFRTYTGGFESEIPRASLPRDEAALAVAHERHRIAALEAYDGRAVGGIAGTLQL